VIFAFGVAIGILAGAITIATLVYIGLEIAVAKGLNW